VGNRVRFPPSRRGDRRRTGAGEEDRLSGEFVIRRAVAEPGLAAALAGVLIDCTEGGASVGFMLPLGQDRAEAYWASALESATRGERMVLVAENLDSGAVVGTVQVVLGAPENQPHRGEVSKMLVHRRARHRGLGEALMRAAEAAAFEAGKDLLVLDTASADAERLYERLGWQRVGAIPGYALWPDGGLVDTTIFYKRLTGPVAADPAGPRPL
jgi:ribosomal protein S18 acetylase RimI-like enzyme